MFNSLPLRLGYPLLALLVALFASACHEVVMPTVKPSDFSKTQRENLGDQIRIEIASQQNTFTVLPDIPPYDTTVYRFVRTLYNQVTNELRLDRNAPNTDKWDANRFWEVTILQDDRQNAFVIPGGHFYITTGLLKSLQREYELYYILAFESILMNDRHLLNRLITEYNTFTLLELADEKKTSEGVTIGNLVDLLPQVEFTADVIRKIDEEVAEIICQSSVMDRRGIISYLDETYDWFNYRPNYGDRSDFILNLEDMDNCGTFRTNGSYRLQVLNWLP